MSFQDALMQIALQYGYLGVFVIAFVSALTLFLPTPAFAIVFLLGASTAFNPFLLGVFGGAGAALGEMSSYYIGMGASATILRKYKKEFDRFERKFQKYAPGAVIFVFAATPLPIDVVGIFCGVVKYPWKKFLFYVLLGKLVKYLFLAYAGFYGFEWVKQYFAF